MVKRAFPLLALPALLLAGCSFFTASLFPGFLAQTDKSFDLGSKIDGFLTGLGSADYRWYSQAFVLTSGTVDYGGVLIEIDSLPAKLLLMADAAGNLQQLPDPAGGFGRLRLKDAFGEFVVGQWHFAPGSLPSALYSGGVSPDSFGFSVGSLNYLVYTSGTLSINYQEFDTTWTSTGAADVATVDMYGNYDLRGVYYDPLGIAGREVTLVFFDSMYNRARVFFTPVANYAISGLAALYAYAYLDFNDVEASNVIYTRKGIVLADFDGNAVLKDFNGNDTGKSLDLGQNGEARVAFDIEGDTFYVFTPKDQMLYRGNTGW